MKNLLFSCISGFYFVSLQGLSRFAGGLGALLGLRFWGDEVT